VGGGLSRGGFAPILELQISQFLLVEVWGLLMANLIFCVVRKDVDLFITFP
jgi:hypothetical protein